MDYCEARVILRFAVYFIRQRDIDGNLDNEGAQIYSAN